MVTARTTLISRNARAYDGFGIGDVTCELRLLFPTTFSTDSALFSGDVGPWRTSQKPTGGPARASAITVLDGSRAIAGDERDAALRSTSKGAHSE